MEGTAAVAVAALYAPVSSDFQIPIVIPCQDIPGLGQIIILVDEPDMQARRAGCAVVAVDADPLRILGRKGSDNGIIPLLLRCLHKSQNTLQILPAADSGNYRQNSGLIQRILDTLVFRQGFAEGRCPLIQKLSSAEGFHDGNSHALPLTAPVQFHSLIHAADAVIAPLIIVSRINRKHHHIQHAHVQHQIGQLRRVGGKSHMADNPLLLQPQNLIDHPVRYNG